MPHSNDTPTDADVASFEGEEPTEVMAEQPRMSVRGEAPPAPASAVEATAPPAPEPAAVAESKDRAYVAPRVIPTAAVPEVPTSQPRIVLNVATSAPTASSPIADDAQAERRRRRAPTVKIERAALGVREPRDEIATLPEGTLAAMPPPAFQPKLASPATEELDIDVASDLADAPPPKRSRAPFAMAALALVAATGASALYVGLPRAGRSAATESPALGKPEGASPDGATALAQSADAPRAEPTPEAPVEEPQPLEAASAPPEPVETAPPVAPVASNPAASARPPARVGTATPPTYPRAAPKATSTSKKTDVPREI